MAGQQSIKGDSNPFELTKFSEIFSNSRWDMLEGGGKKKKKEGGKHRIPADR